MGQKRRKNRPGACFWHDDYLLIRDELSIEQKGFLLDAVMAYSMQICDRKRIDDDTVEDVEPVIDTDDAKLQLYFRFLASKVQRDELEYRENSRQNAQNRQAGIAAQKAKKEREGR